MDGQMDTLKDQIIAALRKFTAQRSGMDPRNYSDYKSYRGEQRSITADLHDARELIRSVELSGITASELQSAFSAFSGRLSLTLPGIRQPSGLVSSVPMLYYCTGQYFPTEYRKAVCAICASALWTYYREDFAKTARSEESAGDAIRRCFKAHYGARLQKRWFN